MDQHQASNLRYLCRVNFLQIEKSSWNLLQIYKNYVWYQDRRRRGTTGQFFSSSFCVLVWLNPIFNLSAGEGKQVTPLQTSEGHSIIAVSLPKGLCFQRTHPLLITFIKENKYSLALALQRGNVLFFLFLNHTFSVYGYKIWYIGFWGLVVRWIKSLIH